MLRRLVATAALTAVACVLEISGAFAWCGGCGCGTPCEPQPTVVFQPMVVYQPAVVYPAPVVAAPVAACGGCYQPAYGVDQGPDYGPAVVDGGYPYYGQDGGYPYYGRGFYGRRFYGRGFYGRRFYGRNFSPRRVAAARGRGRW